jgi:AraC-like DNA-binding protein
MLLLDTADLPRSDRTEAFRVAMQEATVPCRVEHRAPPGELRARMHLWPYGRTWLFTTDASGFRLTRTPRHVRMESPPVVAIAYQARGRGEFAQLGHEQVVSGDDLMLVDLTAPYSFGCAAGGGSRAFMVPYEQLALPVDVVRRAAPRLASSRLHDLVCTHLRCLSDSAAAISGDPAAAALGVATVELVRALIVSAAGDEGRGRTVREQTLATRVRAHVAQHVNDPGLSARTIAAVHNVSERRLYQVFADAGLSLEQEVIGQRLDAARAALVSPSGRHRSIAATARAHGFPSPSHFTRRFRRAYGLTPREWQQVSLRAGR